MTPDEKFRLDVANNIERLRNDADLQAAARVLQRELSKYDYVHNFRWLGRPIIQPPCDIVGFQELIWEIRPTKIIDCGIAHGGSLILNASILALLDLEDRKTNAESEIQRQVIGIDIDIRAHNRKSIEAHFLNDYITMVEGSSIDKGIVDAVKANLSDNDVVLVILDSNHTHDHVFQELVNYAPLVSKGSYCVVADSIIEYMPEDSFPDRDWKVGNSPRSATVAYLASLGEQARGADGEPLQFEVDEQIAAKLVFSSAVGGFLRRC